MRTTISVCPPSSARPPNSVNGGYACGLMGKHIDGPSTAVLRAPPPLDTPIVLVRDGDVVRMESEAGVLIGEARPGDAGLIPCRPRRRPAWRPRPAPRRPSSA